ncbi:hypothetical protein [Melghirimyces thermohalophilus]|nr:hypothetical protein [Melghirimyces thermohalophilus]
MVNLDRRRDILALAEAYGTQEVMLITKELRTDRLGISLTP